MTIAPPHAPTSASAPRGSFEPATRQTGRSPSRPRSGGFRNGGPRKGGFSKPTGPKPEPVILAQTYFKSVGPRTYAAQLKRAANGNHFLVFTEGQRDEKTKEVRKTRLFVYSEDFVEFFKMLKRTSEFVKAHPLDPKVKAKREKFWAKKSKESAETPAAEEPVANAAGV